jgi:hypothetical protein
LLLLLPKPGREDRDKKRAREHTAAQRWTLARGPNTSDCEKSLYHELKSKSNWHLVDNKAKEAQYK